MLDWVLDTPLFLAINNFAAHRRIKDKCESVCLLELSILI